MRNEERYGWALSPRDQLWHRVAARGTDSLSESGFSFTASCLVTFPSDEFSDRRPAQDICPTCLKINQKGGSSAG